MEGQATHVYADSIARTTTSLAAAQLDVDLRFWIGNTERIARRHYLQITEADFDQANGLQRAAKSAAISSSEYAQLAQAETQEPRLPAQNADNAVLVGSSSAQDRI